jgi:membrane fusion protein, multidrug efflux system
VIRSPISGVVANVTAAAGEVVQVGRSLAELESTTALRLLLQVPAAHQALLRPGIPVSVSLPHQPAARYSGTLRGVVPAANPETGTVGAEVWLPNGNGALRSGLVVNGELKVAGGRSLPLVPTGSVFAQGGEQYVWRLDADGKVHQTRVTLGTESNEMVQVLEGLRPGERLVRDGRRSIADETPYTLAVGGGREPE